MFDVASLVSRVCYLLTVFFNSTLIYLTLYQTKEIVGTYRNMIITFAVIGISFSTLDILVRPMFHSFNGCLLFFTLGNTFRFSKSLSKLSLLVYCGTYSFILAFLTVQFMYRAAVLARPQWTKHFDGFKLFYWLLYSFFIGFLWSLSSSWLSLDQNVFDYLRAEILETYGVEIQKVAGFAILAYNGEMSFSNIRWNSVACLAVVTLILVTQYSIMLLAGIFMYRRISSSINSSSTYYSGLQKQFFMTLIYQVSAPSLIFHAPAFIVIVTPFFDLKYSFNTAFIIYGFSAYPLVDSLIVLNVISEYKNSFKRCLRWLFDDCYKSLGYEPSRPPPSTSSVSISYLAKI